MSDFRRFQPSRKANRQPQYVFEESDEKKVQPRKKKAIAGRLLRKNALSSPVWTKDSSSSGEEDDLPNGKDPDLNVVKKAVLSQTLIVDSRSSIDRDSECEPSALKSSQSYREALSSMPTTREGLIKQCNLIAERAEELKNIYKICLSPCLAVYSMSELQNIVKDSEKFGKIGINLDPEVLKSLEDAIELEEPSSQTSSGSTWGPLENLAPLEEPAVHLEIENDPQLEKAYKKEEKQHLEHVFKGDLVENQIVGTAGSVSFGFLGVMAVYDAACLVDLKVFFGKVRCVSYDPSFNSCLVNLPLSDCRITVFPNGKMIVMGANSIKTSLIATRNVLELLKKCGFFPQISKRRFLVRNMTAMIDVGCQVDITEFAAKYPTRAFIDAEIFGVVSFMADKEHERIHRGQVGLTYQIFATGRIVMVGGKTEKHLIRTFREDVFPLLKPYLGNRRPGLTPQGVCDDGA